MKKGFYSIISLRHKFRKWNYSPKQIKPQICEQLENSQPTGATRGTNNMSNRINTCTKTFNSMRVVRKPDRSTQEHDQQNVLLPRTTRNVLDGLLLWQTQQTILKLLS